MAATACAGGDEGSAATTADAAPPAVRSATTSVPGVSTSRLRLGMAVHVDQPEHTIAFWKVVLLGALEAADASKVDLEIHGDADPAVQARLVETLIADGVDGLIVTLADPEAMTPALDRAADVGIPVITINSGIEHYLETSTLTHVGQYDSTAGRMVGERLAEMGAAGDVLCVIQETNNIALEERCNGLEEGFRLGAVARVRFDRELSKWADAVSVISNELEDGEFAAVVTLDLAAGFAAAEATEAARRGLLGALRTRPPLRAARNASGRRGRRAPR